MKVRFTKTALKQLYEVLTYIQAYSPEGASNVYKRINGLLRTLEFQPRIGARTDDPRIRRAVATPYPYIILYQVREGEIVIRSVRHGARRSH